MELNKIVQRINELLAGEILSYGEMVPYLDSAIDDINSELGSTYPVFSELEADQAEYSFFPDRYVRSVVCYGAAYYFYQTDEEGGQPPPGYTQTYMNNLFLMKRDWIQYVPVQYEQLGKPGAVLFDVNSDGEEQLDMGVFKT